VSLGRASGIPVLDPSLPGGGRGPILPRPSSAARKRRGHVLSGITQCHRLILDHFWTPRIFIAFGRIGSYSSGADSGPGLA